MKICLSLLLILFTTTISFTQTTKNIVINVDVLGRKHPTVRYYHPINGVYKISPIKSEHQKAVLKKLPRFVFIDPTKNLVDSITAIQANSLRYYINLNQAVYVNWAMGNDSTNLEKLDRYKIEAEIIKKKNYQNLVQNYFNPFFMGKYEITNYEYKQFVNWVKDSIVKEAIYASELITDEQACDMLNYPSLYYDEEQVNWKKFDPKERQKNRKLFSFKNDFDYSKAFEDSLVIKITASFYAAPNERFYKRRVFNSRLANYQYYSIDKKAIQLDTIQKPIKKGQNSAIRGHRDRTKYMVNHNLNIYPDTLVWTKNFPQLYNNPMTNMYFWHPAFDNYPVVGISWKQAKAYCNWKQKQLEKSNPKIAALYEYDLPNQQEYEWAASLGQNNQTNKSTQDNALITDLILLDKGEIILSLSQGLTKPVNVPNGSKRGKYYTAKQLEKSAKQSGQNYLKTGINYLSNNVSEWMNEDYENNYEQLFEAYTNYNCFADIYYCEDQLNIDLRKKNKNNPNGKLIIGGNWYDERYGTYSGINTAGIYPKTYQYADSSYATVGFRCVLRLKENFKKHPFAD